MNVEKCIKISTMVILPIAIIFWGFIFAGIWLLITQ